MKKQIVDDIAEDLGRISDLLDAALLIQVTLAHLKESEVYNDDTVVLLQYSKAFLESSFSNLQKLQ